MTAPLVRVVEEGVPAAAAGASDDTLLGQAPFAGTVTTVEYVPEAAITGQATNFRTVSLVNKAQDGTGTAVVATLAFDSGGVTATANNERIIPLSVTPANLVVAAGDTLQWRSVFTGSGLADPGGIVRVTISRT